MEKTETKSGFLKTLLILAALAGLIAVPAFFWQLASDIRNDASSATQSANQIIQISQQQTEIALANIQNELLSKQATLAAQKSSLEAQTPLPGETIDYSVTAIAIEATRRSVSTKQVETEATQTALSQPLPTSLIVVRAEDIIPQIKGRDGAIQEVMSWWMEVESGNRNDELDPSTTVLNQNCFGLAWNTNQYGYHRLVVFQKPMSFTFADGGWYSKVCTPTYIIISPEDVGEIQADWLGKRYGIDNHPWQVTVIK